MESRKIYISGGSTYVMSLPKKWVVKEELKAGDSLAVNIQEGRLIIEPSDKYHEPVSTEIRVSQLGSADALRRLLIANYLVGYDTIHIELDKEPGKYREAIGETLGYLIGAEVLEDTGNRVTVEVLLDPNRMQTLQVLQRIHVICRSMLTDIIAGLKRDDNSSMKEVQTREKEVDKLYFLVVRQLKSAVRYHQVSERLGITNQRDALGYRIVVKSFERIADHLALIASNFSQGRGGGWLQYGEFADLVDSIYKGASKSFFTSNKQTAEEVFLDVRKCERQRGNILNELFRKKTNVQDTLAKRAVLESLSRIANYSSDIAEITINMSIKVP